MRRSASASRRTTRRKIFGQGLNFLHLGNATLSHSLIRGLLMLTGLYWRGLKSNSSGRVTMSAYSPAITGRRHLDLTPMRSPASRAFAGASKGRSTACSAITTICMVPALEEMGIRMLLERERIERGGASIHLAGIEDAHYYRMDNIEKAAEGIPHREFSILLSHTPEIYRQAAHADFNVLLSGHTHGGQICLPGGIPITLNCVLPCSMGNGSFNHHGMIGYTSAGAGVSIVPARFNCPPEVTLHHLHRPS
jgi:uncharacterized protein